MRARSVFWWRPVLVVTIDGNSECVVVGILLRNAFFNLV